jgi:glutaredoxin 3
MDRVCENGVCSIRKTTVAQTIPETLITNHKIVVFSMKNCPFCTVAKNIIEKHTTSYKEELYKHAYHDWIVAKTGRSSLPAVFIKGEYVGGCNDGGLGGVSKLDRQGLLKMMLE